MKITLERKDPSLYEKVDLRHQFLKRFLDADKSAGEPIALKVVNGDQKRSNKMRSTLTRTSLRLEN